MALKQFEMIEVAHEGSHTPPRPPQATSLFTRTHFLDHQETSPGMARRITTECLTAWGVPRESIDDVLLVVSELVTNAIQHARPTTVLCLTLNPSRSLLRIDVMDGGCACDEQPTADPDEHGRGHMIIEQLCRDHGTWAAAGFANNWAELPI
ncbi:ATP-binding protein [Streptomyces sp. R11]|uniref:ATP-binding protein n=1 Tax=Streptomyces sp. R11 TaxID=3238625 RepID=A0AB39NCH9_9ACTN